MFGRKRHAAPAAPPPSPLLSAEQLFDVVNARVADFIGENGAWTVVRREADADTLFHGMLAHSIAAQITNSILTEQERVPVHEPAGVSGGEPDEKWKPAPITMIADLRRPVSIDAAEREGEARAA